MGIEWKYGRGLRSGALVVLVLTLVLGVPASAQDGEANGRAAILSELVEARHRLDTLPSFREEVMGHSLRSFVIGFGGHSQSVTSRVDWARTAVVVLQEDEPHIQADLLARIEEAGQGVLAPRAYTVEAEARRVGDTLYLSLAYAGPQRPDLPDLPRGWIVIDDPAGETLLQHLHVAELVTRPALVGEQALLVDVADTVEKEAMALADGTEAYRLAVTVGPEGLATWLGQRQASPIDPTLVAAISGSLSPESVLQIEAVMTAEGIPIAFSSLVRVEAQGVDAALLFPETFPPGVTLTVTFEEARDEHYSAIGEPLPVAVAPEGIAR